MILIIKKINNIYRYRGRFLYYRYCTGVSQSKLLFFGVYRSNFTLMSRTYAGPKTQNEIVNWISQNMHDLGIVYEIRGYHRLRHFLSPYRSGDFENTKAIVYLLTYSNEVPLYFSALGLKYSGRARFMTVNISSKTGQLFLQELGDNRTRMVISALGRNVTFGQELGEFQTYDSLDTHLRLRVCIEFTDVFNLIFLIIAVIRIQMVLFNSRKYSFLLSQAAWLFVTFSFFYISVLAVYSLWPINVVHLYNLGLYSLIKQVKLFLSNFVYCLIPNWMVSFCMAAANYRVHMKTVIMYVLYNTILYKLC